MVILLSISVAQLVSSARPTSCQELKIMGQISAKVKEAQTRTRPALDHAHSTHNWQPHMPCTHHASGRNNRHVHTTHVAPTPHPRHAHTSYE